MLKQWYGASHKSAQTCAQGWWPEAFERAVEECEQEGSKPVIYVKTNFAHGSHEKHDTTTVSCIVPAPKHNRDHQ